ncbi:MAG: ankyrin repeat domain-containing protein [Burkholderiaceae bacterium]|jgi:hypothetical protein|nr:ankyrin repeat domain-containing protein [Burkholderiaceae bacterium]
MNHKPTPGDDLVNRYHQAIRIEGATPDAQLRARVLAQARALTEKAATAAPITTAPARHAQAPAANDRRWLLTAVASIAVVGLSSLLALQWRHLPQQEDLLQENRPQAAPQTAAAPNPAATREKERAEPAPRQDAAQEPPPAQDAAIAEETAPPARAAAKPQSGPWLDAMSAPWPASKERLSRQKQAGTQSRASRAIEHEERKPAAPGAAAAQSLALPPPPTSPAPENPPADRLAAARQTQAAPAAADLDAMADERAAASQPSALAAGRTAAQADPASEVAATPAAAPQPFPESDAALGDAAATAPQARQNSAAPVGAPHCAGCTPLMLAAGRGDHALVRKLLQTGADARRKDAQNRTAADHARQAGHADLARLLDAAAASNATGTRLPAADAP